MDNDSTRKADPEYTHELPLHRQNELPAIYFDGFEGTITWEQIAPYLARQGSFIPGQLGLEDLQHRFALPGSDHPWHQIAPDDITPTEAAPTNALTPGELAERFGHTLWKADWLVAGAALKVTVVKPAILMDGTVHTYAHGKGSPQIRAARPLGRERHRLARNKEVPDG